MQGWLKLLPVLVEGCRPRHEFPVSLGMIPVGMIHDDTIGILRNVFSWVYHIAANEDRIFLQLKGLLIRNWTFRSERYRKKGHWFHCNYYISRGCHAMIHYGIVAVAPALFEPEAGVPLVASLCSRLSKDVGYGSKLGTWIIGWLVLKIDKSICGLPSL